MRMALFLNSFGISRSYDNPLKYRIFILYKKEGNADLVSVTA